VRQKGGVDAKTTALEGLMPVGVENYFQVEAFADQVDRRAWDSDPSGYGPAARPVRRALREGDFFNFSCGLLERHPRLVREIVGRDMGPSVIPTRIIDSLSQRESREDTTNMCFRCGLSCGARGGRLRHVNVHASVLGYPIEPIHLFPFLNSASADNGVRMIQCE
jgi:hypothetical protein